MSRTGLSDFTFTFHLCALGKKMATPPGFLPGESQGRRSWWAAIYGVAQSRSNLAATAAGELDISDIKQKHTPILPTILGPLIH